MSKLQPEEVLHHALADLTLLARDIETILHRADGTMPGPGAASSSGSARGFDVDDPHFDQERPDPTDDEHVPMTRGEARALNGPDAAERAARAINESLARIRRDVANINRQAAPFRQAGKPFDPNDVPEDWCPNCYRQGGRRHTPTRKSKGRPNWTEGWCNFCGNFLAARRREDEAAGLEREGWLPTRKILDIQFGPVGSGRITEQLLTAEERKLPRALKAKGTRRRGRSPMFTTSDA